MKVFFGLLLIVNIAFAVFQWLLPYEQLFVEKKKIPAAVELQLLSEANIEIVSESRRVAEAEAEAETTATASATTRGKAKSMAEVEKPVHIRSKVLVVEDTSDKRICYTIGPFKDKERATEINGRYSSKRADTSLKSSLQRDYQGVMVYIDGHKTREEAVRTANRLAAKGIRDHIIVNNPDSPNLLSLGVFGLKKNADKLRDRVVKLGFRAKSEARYRERTIFWLYAEQSSESEYLQLLDDADFDTGISQTPTECLPT
ncbi:MAG: hypothetical protein OES20_15690 [Gammaproteobacteria bacterium]|nr:hypothetical protein [Gammaproteobacteria bacterium]